MDSGIFQLSDLAKCGHTGPCNAYTLDGNAMAAPPLSVTTRNSIDMITLYIVTGADMSIVTPNLALALHPCISETSRYGFY
jgi:hypothetical protein